MEKNYFKRFSLLVNGVIIGVYDSIQDAEEAADNRAFWRGSSLFQIWDNEKGQEVFWEVIL